MKKNIFLNVLMIIIGAQTASPILDHEKAILSGFIKNLEELKISCDKDDYLFEKIKKLQNDVEIFLQPHTGTRNLKLNKISKDQLVDLLPFLLNAAEFGQAIEVFSFLVIKEIGAKKDIRDTSDFLRKTQRFNKTINALFQKCTLIKQKLNFK